jgi:peptide chain release factor 1
MNLQEKLESILVRHEELTQMLTQEQNREDFINLSKELSSIEDIVRVAKEYLDAQKQMKDDEEMMNDPEMDPELKQMANEEFYQLKERLPQMEHEIKVLLLPKDEADDRNVILEIRAGTGGEEAALFGAELFRMYERYAALKKWRFEVLSLNETGLNGYKEAVAQISGNAVFARLKYESGVHRVQRVPETETSGRVHTSAATVAVLPEAKEVDVQINEADLEITTCRASGAGGQHVNKTDSAIRIVHKPTGLAVECQEERSQFKNKEKALVRLRTALYDMERQKADKERSDNRKSQVGSGDRSERIRTYNYPQGRVTDHRINKTVYQLPQVLNGEGLDDFIEALITEDQMQRLAEG